MYDSLMARSETFSLNEIALAADTTKRAAQFISDNLMLRGRGPRELKSACAAGALMTAGLPLMVAWPLAETLADINFNDGELPTGLKYLAVKLPREEQLVIANPATDYDCHRALFRHPDLYMPGRAWKSDLVLEIVDGVIVFESSVRFPKPRYVGRFENPLGRGVEPIFKHLVAAVGALDDETNPGWQEQMAALEQEALAARDNGVTFLRVNLSLGIRKGFDRVAEFRLTRARGVGRKTVPMAQDFEIRGRSGA